MNSDQPEIPPLKDPAPKEMTRTGRSWLTAGIAGLAGLVATFVLWIVTMASKSGVPAVAGVFIVPYFIGFCAAIPWRSQPATERPVLGFSFLLTLGCCLGAAIVLREGSVCLAMAFPILWLGVALGLMTSFTLGQKGGRLQFSVVPALIVAMVVDARIPGEKTEVAVDEIVIRAPAAKVFPYVVQFPEITAPPSHWLNRIGLPAAKQTTSDGPFVGAKRACIFSNGLVFPEQITELEPGKRHTFIVTEQPNDPELFGHFDLHKGQFDLRDNGDGTTTLVGTSWYTLRVRPIWYFNLWSKDIIRDVHLRVMNHIKTLAEGDFAREAKSMR